jgi:hypothetical protein
MPLRALKQSWDSLPPETRQAVSNNAAELATLTARSMSGSLSDEEEARLDELLAQFGRATKGCCQMVANRAAGELLKHGIGALLSGE